MRMLGTADQACRATYKRRLTNIHLADVTDDREELARIQRLCVHYQATRHTPLWVFFYVDDSVKCHIPYTSNYGGS